MGWTGRKLGRKELNRNGVGQKQAEQEGDAPGSRWIGRAKAGRGWTGRGWTRGWASSELAILLLEHHLATVDTKSL